MLKVYRGASFAPRFSFVGGSMSNWLAIFLVLFLWDYTRQWVIGFICWMAMSALVLAGVVGTLAFGVIVYHTFNGP